MPLDNINCMKDSLRYIELAHRLNNEHHVRLRETRTHFRGNLNSISLVSLAKETPELGFSGIRTEPAALSRLEGFERGEHRLSLGRPTREKELQAWLIWYAITNDDRLYFDRGLRFITSELALTTAEGRVVNDILAIDDQNDLVVIELKSTRDKQRIEKQVRSFMECIKQRQEFFHSLVKLITGRTWSGGLKGIVVWNAGSRSERRIDTAFREICFLVDKVDGKVVLKYDAHGLVQFKEYA